MKKIYFILFFCCFSTAFLSSMNDAGNGDNEIDLNGNLFRDKQRTLVRPIQIFISDQLVEIGFNTPLGAIDIFIYDEMGNAVYQQSVNADAEQRLFIDISFLDSGEYTIELVNAQGKYLLDV